MLMMAKLLCGIMHGLRITWALKWSYFRTNSLSVHIKIPPTWRRHCISCINKRRRGENVLMTSDIKFQAVLRNHPSLLLNKHPILIKFPR